ncbi:MAG: hypothetical protein HY084_13495 [Gemmatimonadetes bacterium]|nr:hypothetical protein [Gemmatimonadota bacterium]
MHRRTFTTLCALSLLAAGPSRLTAQGCAGVAAGPLSGYKLSAQSTPNGAQLSWRFVSGAHDYCVMRSRDGGKSFTLVANLSGLNSSYVDRTAKAADVYQLIATAPGGARTTSDPVTYSVSASQSTAAQPAGPAPKAATLDAKTSVPVTTAPRVQKPPR